MAKLANRCQETTTTTGTGTLTLAGAVTGYVSFNDSFSNGDVVFYTIDDGLGNWEIGTGTVGTTTLTRDAVIESSNSNALVNFASGSKRVFCTAPSRALLPDQTGNSGKVLSTNGTSPSWTTPTSGTVTSVSGTGTVSGITLSGTVTTSGNLTLGGTLDLSSYNAAGAFTTLSSTGNTTLGDGSPDTLTINAGTTTFAGTGQRITGDFSNATLANRLMFQTSTVNAATAVSVIPNGTSPTSQLAIYSNSDPTNTSVGIFANNSATVNIQSTITGTGAYLPITFFTGGREAMRIGATAGSDLSTLGIGYTSLSGVGEYGLAVSGKVGIGTSSLSSQSKLTIYSDATPSSTYYDLWLKGGSAGVGNDGGGIAFSTAAASAIANPSLAATAIRSLNTYGSESNGEQGDLAFYTNRRTGANTYTGLTERLRIDSSGNVGIGTNSPAFALGTGLQIASTGYVALSLKKGSAGVGHAIDFVDSTNTLQYRIGTNFASGGTNLLFAYGSTPTLGMTLDTSGNLGLGVTPNTWYSGTKAIEIGATTALMDISGQTNLYQNAYLNSSGALVYKTSNFATEYRMLSGQHQWMVAPSGTAGNPITFTQAMTLDASGRLIVGDTSPLVTSAKISIIGSDVYGDTIVVRNANATAGKYWRVGYVNNSSTWHLLNQSGTGMYLTDGATSWSNTSDERLKTDLRPIINAAQKVSTLRAVTGRFKTDEEGVSRAFLIAQDVQKVLPEAVDSLNPDKLGVAYTDTIPLLVAAIQELHAEIETLKAKVN